VNHDPRQLGLGSDRDPTRATSDALRREQVRGSDAIDEMRHDSTATSPASILATLVRECLDRGYSPTLETWNERVRPVLERLAGDGSDPRLAEQSARVLAAWDVSIEVVNRLWAEGDRRASQDSPADPGPGATPDVDGDGQ
jgi:hypothetical protein